MKRRLIVISTGLVIGAAAVSLGWLVLPENLLGGFVIFAGLIYCIGGGLFLALGRAPQQVLMTPSSDRTILYLAPGALLVLLGAPLEYHFLPQTLLHSPLMQWLGTLILVLGFSIRLWTRRTLKEDYQGNLQVHPDQSLITGGPYHWVRHPGYLGFIVMAAGLAVGFSSLAGLFGVILLAVGFRARIQVEQQMLRHAFGQAYIAYARRTGCLLPILFHGRDNR